MKKVFALILVAIFVCCAAFAAEVKPFEDVNMAESLDNCTLHVGIKLDNVTDKGLVADVYNEQRYDAVEVTALQPGDTVICMGEEVVVEKVEEDYSIYVNGGSEEDGVTLCPDEGGTYVALDYETPLYMMVGQAEFPFADEVFYTHWQEEPDGGISSEMAAMTVPAAQVKDVLTAEGSGEFYPDSALITIENGCITEIAINYVP